MTDKNFLEINRELWNQRSEIHINTEFYDLENFKAGETSLKKIELDILGDVQNKKILHLQCHFGQDSLSLARMGAKVTGFDLSEKGIEIARSLNSELNLSAEFIVGNTYQSAEIINKKFDIVYMSYGAICWLPELDTLVKNVSELLNPGGKFIVVEFHPALMIYSEDYKNIEFSYFNTGSLYEEFEGTYADKNSSMKQKSVTWNHSIADLIKPLINKNFNIDHFDEYDYSPYDLFPNPIKTEFGFREKLLGDKIPYVFSIVASK